MRETLARHGRNESRPSRIFVKALALAAFSAAASVAMADAKPAHLWNFDRLGWHSRQAEDLGDGAQLREMRGRIATGQGTGGSDALRADVASGGEVTRLPLPFAAWTFDCSFRIDVPDAGVKERPIFRYETSAAKCVSVTIERDSLAVRSGTFSAMTEPQGVADGRIHLLRLSVSKVGLLRMWIDGRCVLEKPGAPALRSLGAGDAKRGYPVLRLGMSGNGAALGGVMDDIAIYDRALGAPDLSVPVGDYSRIALPEYRAVPPSDGAEALVFGADGAAATGPFKVADAMDAQVFGQMNPAAAKFVDAAASATISISGGEVRVTVDCPVPPGMKADHHDDPWSGDRALVYIRPRLDEPQCFIYCANAAGRTAGGMFGAEREGWRSHAKMSVKETDGGFSFSLSVPVADIFGDRPPRPGDTFGLNFSREGRTCGGHSSWAVNSGRFNDAKWTFGTAVFGGAKPYFSRRLAEAKARGASVADGAAAQAAVDAACRAVGAAVSARGNSPAAFASLERMFEGLDRTLLSVAQKARPLLVYRPADAWGNMPEPDLDSRPLDIIRIRAPRGTRRVVAFAIANLQSEPFAGNLKFFDRFDGFYRTGSRLPPPKDGIARRFTLRRSVAVGDRDGRPMYDPLAELPLRSLVEVAPGKALPIFAELDTHGVASGRHYALLLLRSATAGFPDERIAVEVTVTDDDLCDVPTDRAGYTHLATSFGAGLCPLVSPATNCVRRLVERGYNVVLLARIADIYPMLGEDGKWRRPSYEVLDRYVDAWIAGGLDPKRMKLWPYLGVERKTDLCWGLRDHTGRRVPFGTTQYDIGLRALVGFFAEHVRERYGVGRDRILWYPVDEASGDMDDPTFKSSASRALHAGRVIRSENAANVLFWNPLPGFIRGGGEGFRRAMKECAGLFDIIELYRPATTPEVVSLVKELGFRKVWGYHISTKHSGAAGYRSAVWKHLRDGFSETMAYWHMDESASLDARPQHPYGTCYIDWDADELMLSRRQLAADMAAEDARLVNYLRQKAKGDPAKLALIESIVKAAADGGTMAAMDAALEQLQDANPVATQKDGGETAMQGRFML